MATKRNTSYQVRPDKHTTEEINNLIPSESVIVYDTDKKVIKFRNGTEWVEIAGDSETIARGTYYSQGYYGLLTDFYFDGNATETIISLEDVDDWIDVLIDVSANGTFDRRPLDMKEVDSVGITGDGTDGNPIIFSLEGLDTNAFLNFRASMAFEPEDDEGQLEARLLFNRHSGTTPSEDFSIEEVSLSMFNGADVDYVTEPMLSFFVGDTIDTNAAGDAGKCRFQIKSNVTGIIKLRALTWYINK